MSYRPHDPPTPGRVSYDPVTDLPEDHLARLVELVVEAADLPHSLPGVPGQPAYDPRLCAKVLVYGYATAIRSSRQLERACNENLPFLFLTRGDTPSYRTLCSFRVHQSQIIEKVWGQLFEVAAECGMKRLGRIVIDSSKLRADVSPEAVVTAKEYEQVLAELKSILERAQQQDDKDDQDPPGQTSLGQPIETEQMRDILRRVRKRGQAHQASSQPEAPVVADTKPEKPIGPRMLARLEQAIQTIETALLNQEKFACLTDADARMMSQGREKSIRECHSLEVVVDKEDALLVVGQSCQSAVDNARLLPLVAAAREQEPTGLVSVDADSGYYGGDALGALLAEGIDTCIPDSNTACDLHRGRQIGTTLKSSRGNVVLEYDAGSDSYHCAQGNTLSVSQRRVHWAQQVRVYRAQQECTGCPQASDCLSNANAKHRTVLRGDHAHALEAARQRFSEPEHQQRYHRRADAVETIFGFIRGSLGYLRWMLRGKERVASEACLFKTAYQVRKIHLRWSMQTM